MSSDILQLPSIPAVPVETVQPDPIPEMVVQPVDVASPSTSLVSSARRKQSLITPEMDARIKRKELKQKERTAKKKLLKEQAEHAKQELLAPVSDVPAVPDKTPEQLTEHLWKPGVSGNPAGRPKTKYTRDAIVKVIAEVKAIDKKDPNVSTRWQKLMSVLYERALGEEIKTADLMLIMSFLAERLDGKSSAEEDGSGEKNPMLVVNIGTRFSPTPSEAPKVDVIEVQSCK